MRVIAGLAKGVPLQVGGEARPYLEKTRGAIFNSLCAEVPEAKVLDLYAGSGSMGIEALSRGAATCVFVEADKDSVGIIEANLRKCKLEAGATVLRSRAGTFVSGCREEFGLIFVDPPFPEIERWQNDPEAGLLRQNLPRLLEPDGRLIFRFEHRRADAPEWPGLQLAADRLYGRSRVLVYTR